MKTQEEVTQSKVAISIADVKGNDEIHGQDIADLREVAQEKPKEEVEEIFMAAEQMPQFPGGPGRTAGISGEESALSSHCRRERHFGYGRRPFRRVEGRIDP